MRHILLTYCTIILIPNGINLKYTIYNIYKYMFTKSKTKNLKGSFTEFDKYCTDKLTSCVCKIMKYIEYMNIYKD